MIKVNWNTETPIENGDYWIIQKGKVSLGYFLAYDKTFRFCGDPYPYHIKWLNNLEGWAKVEYPAAKPQTAVAD